MALPGTITEASIDSHRLDASLWKPRSIFSYPEGHFNPPSDLTLTSDPNLFRERPVQDGHGLCAGAGSVRAEGGCRGPRRDSLLIGPEDSFHIVGSGLQILKRGFGDGRLNASLHTPEEGHNLRSVAGFIRAEGRLGGSGSDAVFVSPKDRFVIVATTRGRFLD